MLLVILDHSLAWKFFSVSLPPSLSLPHSHSRGFKDNTPFDETKKKPKPKPNDEPIIKECGGGGGGGIEKPTA